MKLINSKNQGFTLIELMIVVAIIGILAAVAIPAYQSYTKRAYVSEGIQMADNIKTSLAEYYATTGAFPTAVNSNASIGLPATATSMAGNAVRSIRVNQSRIEVTFRTKVITGATIFLQATIPASGGSITWDCTGGNLQNIYRPSNCK